MHILIFCTCFLFCSSAALAQLGAGRPDISWYEFDTQHFTIVYHEGLDSIAHEAARIAEAVYPVVTGNLHTELSGRTPIYLSDLDDVPNAFALGSKFIYIWVRGILDDRALGGIRSAGRAKWLRTVITHEFTHTVISHATEGWLNNILQTAPDVPRWFHEGTARFMEPDGWTTDLDMVLRVAAVNGDVEYNGMDRLSGHVLYETGHSLVRYMTWRFGDSVLGRIVNGSRSWGSYSFEEAVKEATEESMSDIYNDWRRHVTVLYGSNYGIHEETIDITPPLTKKVSFTDGIRFSPDGSRLALLGGDPGQRVHLVVLEHPSGRFTGDSGAVMRVLSDEPGFDREFSWSPDGLKIVLSKLRYGSHSALVHDLYILDVETCSLSRLTSDAALTDPAWSPDGKSIAAVYKRMGRDQLVLVDPTTGSRRILTSFTGDVQIYTPSWSPDGSQIAFSLFDEEGRRCIAIVNSEAGTTVRRLVCDTANNRYPVWSPDGQRIAFTSHASGIPNVQIVHADGSDRHFVTDVAGGVYTVQWKPGSDSILVISFDSRSSIYPHLIPTSRTATPAPAPAIREKYSAWRSVALPLQVPPQEHMPETATSNAGAYSSLANMDLMLILPLISTGHDPDGDRTLRNFHFQVLSSWRDPMGIHGLFGLADIGALLKESGGFLSYTNNWLPVSISLYGGSQYGFSGVIDDISLLERKHQGGLGLSYTLPTPNSLLGRHTFSLGGGYRSLEPHNIKRFAEADLVPVRARLVELTAGYTYSADDVFFDVGYRRSDRSFGATHEFNRVTAIAEWGLVLNSWTRSQFVTRAEGTALWGEQIAQEFVGIDAYDQFEGGFNLLETRLNHRVRGVRHYKYGDHVFVGSVGFRQPLFTTPMAFLLFAELGTAWFADYTDLGQLQFQRGYGMEFQMKIPGDLRLTGGLAFEMKSNARRDLYVRVVKGL